MIPDSISIHAPVKGATSESPNPDVVGSDFNPRPREGSDMRIDVHRGF